MGLFKTKLSTIENKLTAVDDRIQELKRRAASKEKDVTATKTTLGERIAEGAMSDSETVQQAMSHSKKALQRTSEALEEIRLQIEVLEKQKTALEADRKRAIVDESPERLEGIAREFNKTLETALGKLAELSGLHADLVKYQTAFHALLQDRQRAMSSLSVMVPLGLTVGLGELATDATPTPFRYSVQVPDAGLDRFIMELIGYERKLLGYRAFTESNPNHGNMQDVAQDFAGFGSVGDPGRDKSFKQVYEPEQYR